MSLASLLTPELLTAPMTFALFDDVLLNFVSYHAAVFVAVVIVLLAIQWLLDRRR